MAREATVRVGLTVRKDNLTYQSQPGAFVGDVELIGGPTPGTVLISTGGTDVSLSQLVTPGYCHLRNLDETNYVEYGIYEPATSKFYPLGEVRPGESYVLRFSRNLLEEYDGTGTGTSAATNTFRMKANHAACIILVEAFEA